MNLGIEKEVDILRSLSHENLLSFMVSDGDSFESFIFTFFRTCSSRLRSATWSPSSCQVVTS